ncbi:hypothetical protein RRG08_022474 [Elysia crispata]|uniref:UNC93-like protein n=1 Tax=Elysia crispata TaxID=231223 RepID=A0AAE1D8W5_9GAST|nr:hypothetical protein RRG08_022474 [Elysia crispata]
MTKGQILKNVFITCVAFTFLFTAFNSMANLQTSLNKEKGVGAWSMATIYISLILSCMFLPKFVIAQFGCKWAIPISMLGYILFMGSNMYAVIATMVPASIILGIGAAPLWSAQCTYFTQVGVWYAKITNRNKDAVINMFFGYFFLFFQSSQIWGNLISSLVFTPENDNSTSDQLCGADFCPGDAEAENITDNFGQTSEKVYTVCGIYLGSAVLAAIIISLFLDPITLDNDSGVEQGRKLSPKLLVATFKHLFTSPTQMLLIPITVYSGIEQAFIQGDFTQSYISCTLGIWNLGYVMMCYGVVDAICSILFGRLVQYIGHIPFFVLAFLIHGGLQVFLLLWNPSKDQEILFYVFAGLWGMGDAVIQTQLNALYGNIFSNEAEAAFANYRLWESAGFCATYLYNDLYCTSTKLHIGMTILALSVVCYTAVEVITWRSRRNRAEIST